MRWLRFRACLQALQVVSTEDGRTMMHAVIASTEGAIATNATFESPETFPADVALHCKRHHTPIAALLADLWHDLTEPRCSPAF